VVGPVGQCSDAPRLSLRHKRPSDYRINSSFDEIAASHYSPQGSEVRRSWLITSGICDWRLGLGIKLHRSNFEPPMSALGQKRTSEGVEAMSALPPKADITSGLIDYFIGAAE